MLLRYVMSTIERPHMVWYPIKWILCIIFRFMLYNKNQLIFKLTWVRGNESKINAQWYIDTGIEFFSSHCTGIEPFQMNHHNLWKPVDSQLFCAVVHYFALFTFVSCLFHSLIHYEVLKAIFKIHIAFDFSWRSGKWDTKVHKVIKC